MAGKKGMFAARRLAVGNERYQEDMRAKIYKAKLVNALVDHATGDKEMSPTQVQAATVLLRKVMPDLQATEVTQKGRTWIDELRDIQARLNAASAPQTTPEPAQLPPATPDESEHTTH